VSPRGARPRSISGGAVDALLAYGIVVLALVVVMAAWAVRGLRSAEAAG
jgi:hypothetical protein